MGALIFGVMFFLMILGVPIAFSISLSSTAYLMASGNNLVLLAQRLFLGMDSFVLLAVPLFGYPNGSLIGSSAFLAASPAARVL